MENRKTAQLAVTAVLLCLVTIALTALWSGAGNGEHSVARHGLTATSPSLAAAVPSVPIPMEERRVGIVYSAPSAKNYYGEVEYNQLFAAMQFHASQAGLSFDLLDESDIVSGTALANYSVLVFPLMSHVNRANRSAVIDSLVAARQAGVAIVASEAFLVADETGEYFPDGYAAMETVLGLRAHKWRNQLPTQVHVSDSSHAIIDGFNGSEVLVDYDELWFAEYVPVANQTTVPFLDLETSDEAFSGALAYELDSRIVHFSNPQVMADHALLAAAIEWAAYGSRAPVSLLPSRFESVFLARNDMDQAMFAEDLVNTEIPLLQIISDWKERYNFVGSYYLDIGNNPQQGEYTDWSVSGPLYQSYLDLGSEIGTHSWTHPYFTSELSAAELEYEFNQSREELNTKLGIDVIGGAVPGNPENMFVVENLNQWFEYFSGRTGSVGVGYPNAIGYLEPQHTMRYFSLNMSPDFTLVDYLGYSPEQAQQIWQQEFDDLTAHAKLPVLQWLWHDYGPTVSTQSGNYSYEMFDETLNHAHSNGAEFVTLAEYHRRLVMQNATTISVASDEEINVQIEPPTESPTEANGLLGTFALRVANGMTIAGVSNWYAWNDSQVLVPENGGSFSITTGDVPSDVTRVTGLPMRAKLLDVSGDGTELAFSVRGEGKVQLQLHSSLINSVSIDGASAVLINDDQVELELVGNTDHFVSVVAERPEVVEPPEPLNSVPVASNQQHTILSDESIAITLSAVDADSDVLTFEIVETPSNGAIAGTPPDLTYNPAQDFAGMDTFSFRASDGQAQSEIATVSIEVQSPVIPNEPPVALPQSLETDEGQALALILDATDPDGDTLIFNVVDEPVNGVLTGQAPNLVYMPVDGFSGTDSFLFVASDDLLDSSPAEITIQVNAMPVITEPEDIWLGADSVVIDGNLSEWAGLQPIAMDPDDQALPNNRIDWNKLWVTHTNSQVYLAVSNHGSVNSNPGQLIYLDTDGNRRTGYKGAKNEFPIGAEYVIEGTRLHSYKRSKSRKSPVMWRDLGEITAGTGDQGYELVLDRARLGSPSALSVFLYGDNSLNGGTSIDLLPTGSVEYVLEAR